MSDKNENDLFNKIIKRFKRKVWGGNSVVSTVEHPKSDKPTEKKTPAQMIADLDDAVKTKQKDMPCDIFIERDEYGKVKFILKEKDENLEEALGTEFEELTEAFTEAKYDEDDNLIRNVCLLSSISKNNRKYLDEALNNVVSLADGVKIFCDHPKRGEAVRSVKDVIGAIESPHRTDGKIYGNLRVLSSHKNWIFALAKETPNLVGMSIVARGRISPERDSEGREQVESVKSLSSIDLVSEPATTSGLYH